MRDQCDSLRAVCVMHLDLLLSIALCKVKLWFQQSQTKGGPAKSNQGRAGESTLNTLPHGLSCKFWTTSPAPLYSNHLHVTVSSLPRGNIPQVTVPAAPSLLCNGHRTQNKTCRQQGI